MKTPKILKNLDRERICYLQSCMNYTLFFFENGTSVVSGYNIKLFEEILCNDAFVRVNRSKFVNVAFIRKTFVNENNYAVQLVNGEEINISRRRLNKIKELYPTMF